MINYLWRYGSWPANRACCQLRFNLCYQTVKGEFNASAGDLSGAQNGNAGDLSGAQNSSGGASDSADNGLVGSGAIRPGIISPGLETSTKPNNNNNNNNKETPAPIVPGMNRPNQGQSEVKHTLSKLFYPVLFDI